MTLVMEALPQLMDEAMTLVTRLEEAGEQAFLVGGCVRDHALGRACKDADITTSATPDQIATLFPGTELVGAHFGVCLVPFEGKRFEVATFRKDGSYTDHRRPDVVTFTREVKEDLCRRDFTINALTMSSSGVIGGNIHGEDDLRHKVIRTVGHPHHRFTEDALRMLRAVRFAAQLDFSIEQETKNAIQELAETIKHVSTERIMQELSKILTSGHAAYGIQLLIGLDLMQYIIPEFTTLLGCKQNPEHHPEGDVYEHTLGLLRQLPKDCSLTLALAALLHDIGKPATFGLKDGQPTAYGHEDVGAEMTREILLRLKFSSVVVEMVVGHVADHMRFRVVKEMKRSKLFRFVSQPHFDELLQLHRMDALAGSGKLEKAEFVEKVLAETPEHILRPVHLVTGKDLIDMGVKPGPFFRKALEYIQTEQLERHIIDRNGALSALKMLVEREDATA